MWWYLFSSQIDFSWALSTLSFPHSPQQLQSQHCRLLSHCEWTTPIHIQNVKFWLTASPHPPQQLQPQHPPYSPSSHPASSSFLELAQSSPKSQVEDWFQEMCSSPPLPIPTASSPLLNTPPPLPPLPLHWHPPNIYPPSLICSWLKLWNWWRADFSEIKSSIITNC